jgi:hypothetical protein
VATLAEGSARRSRRRRLLVGADLQVFNNRSSWLAQQPSKWIYMLVQLVAYHRYCSKNPDPNYNSCDVPQELSDEAIDQELEQGSEVCSYNSKSYCSSMPVHICMNSMHIKRTFAFHRMRRRGRIGHTSRSLLYGSTFLETSTLTDRARWRRRTIS